MSMAWSGKDEPHGVYNTHLSTATLRLCRVSLVGLMGHGPSDTELCVTHHMSTRISGDYKSACGRKPYTSGANAPIAPVKVDPCLLSRVRHSQGPRGPGAYAPRFCCGPLDFSD